MTACDSSVALKEGSAVNTFPPQTEFRVSLKENHKLGQTWSLRDGFDRAVVEKINSVWHGDEKGIYFNFKSLALGQTTLNFVCRNYTDTVDVKTFIVKISRD